MLRKDNNNREDPPVVEPEKPEGRPLDNPPLGGVKGLTTSTLNIIPFVSEVISNDSPEGMRISTENQFRQVADVTRSFLLAFQRKDTEIAALIKRIEALEPKP